MSSSSNTSRPARWAQLRFAVIGPLLAAPPEPGELRQALLTQAARTWRHPISGEPVQFSAATLERWYYVAKNAGDDPVGALRSHRRRDAGQSRRLSPVLKAALRRQYQAHRHWSCQLHYDNLAARVAQDADAWRRCPRMPPCAGI